MNHRTTAGALAAAALALTACAPTSTGPANAKASPTAPPYKVVDQDTSGHRRTIVVEVRTTKNLRDVFASTVRGLEDEAGYTVLINCSTGGTDDVDNRLANGSYAIGNMGEATTGLEDRGHEFSTNKERKCPDKAPKRVPNPKLPPEPTGVKRAELLQALAAANPDVVRYEDKAIDASRNQCSAFDEGSQRPDWQASQRFTYKDVTTTEAQGKQINAALKRLGFCNV